MPADVDNPQAAATGSQALQDLVMGMNHARACRHTFTEA
jgi:hypothetical protein